MADRDAPTVRNSHASVVFRSTPTRAARFERPSTTTAAGLGTCSVSYSPPTATPMPRTADILVVLGDGLLVSGELDDPTELVALTRDAVARVLG
jgi:hypothetical protein